jgi:hypothetical protein
MGEVMEKLISRILVELPAIPLDIGDMMALFRKPDHIKSLR